MGEHLASRIETEFRATIERPAPASSSTTRDTLGFLGAATSEVG
jgi:hypothetical protein